MQDFSWLNEHMVVLLPGAVYSLFAGCVPFALSHRELFSLSFLDTSEATADGLKACACAKYLWSPFDFCIYSLNCFYNKCYLIGSVGRWNRCQTLWVVWMLCRCSHKNWFQFSVWGGYLFSNNEFFLLTVIWFSLIPILIIFRILYPSGIKVYGFQKNWRIHCWMNWRQT